MLDRRQLNISLPQVLASGGDGQRLWVIVNPAAGTMTFKVIRRDREPFETLSLERALEVYNGE